MAYSTSYRPRFTVDYGVVAVATGLYLALMFYPVTQADFPDVGLLAGVPVGTVVGVLTPRGGDEMNNTLVACGAGATLVVAASAAYGSYVSWQVGFPLDSVLAGQFAIYGFFYGGFLFPLHLLVAFPVAVLVSTARTRIEALLA